MQFTPDMLDREVELENRWQPTGNGGIAKVLTSDKRRLTDVLQMIEHCRKQIKQLEQAEISLAAAINEALE